MDFITNARCNYHAVRILKVNFDKHSDHDPEHIKTEKVSLVLPILILGFLGIEFALKALIESQGQKPPRTHDLKNLYEKLSDNTKSTIKENFNKRVMFKGGRSDFNDWDKFIANNRKGFEFWRYSWEDAPNQTRLISPDMVFAVLLVTTVTHDELYQNVSTDDDSSESGLNVEWVKNEMAKYKKRGRPSNKQ